MIGENATPQDPFLSRESCFEIGVSEDMIKEGREVLALGLDNEDPCICLGRDGAIVIVPPNGSEFSITHVISGLHRSTFICTMNSACEIVCLHVPLFSQWVWTVLTYVLLSCPPPPPPPPSFFACKINL